MNRIVSKYQHYTINKYLMIEKTIISICKDL